MIWPRVKMPLLRPLPPAPCPLPLQRTPCKRKFWKQKLWHHNKCCNPSDCEQDEWGDLDEGNLPNDLEKPVGHLHQASVDYRALLTNFGQPLVIRNWLDCCNLIRTHEWSSRLWVQILPLTWYLSRQYLLLFFLRFNFPFYPVEIP